MPPSKVVLLSAAIFLTAILCSTATVRAEPAKEPIQSKMPEVPPGKQTDIKFYQPSGDFVVGEAAFSAMPEAGVVLWVAGNQFFAMDDVVHAFQRVNPRVSVALITLPPGMVVDAIKANGWRFEGTAYPGRPDLYASVNIGHLQSLNKDGLMNDYMTYMHNELVLMVAKGNPKNIRGIDDLARPDVRTSLPNPINEGIMQFYLRKVLEQHALWQKISAGKECSACATTENNWFTAVHHRETPARILAGQSDVGVVWKTEALEAVRNGSPVDIEPLPPDDSKIKEVSYVIGPLAAPQHPERAEAFIRFLQSPDGQEAYAKHGFVSAAGDELSLRPIPSQPAPAKNTDWMVPDIDKLPNDAWGRLVREGRDLTAATYAHLGPEAADATHGFSGNNMACQNCHLEAGTKKFGLPFVGVFADFPQYRAREGEVGTLEDRINGCLTRSMNGKPLPVDSHEMKAFVAYIKFLSDGRPIGSKTIGRGAAKITELTQPADPVAGAKVFAQTCAVCHGEAGLGKRAGIAGDVKGYKFPPLWGPDSFNDGAGMARLVIAAEFIHSNMPNGVSYDQPALSEIDAWNVAAFVASMQRPHKADLEKDYPFRTEKPADAAYGPHADGFDMKVHKYGPFGPIRDKLKAMKAAAVPTSTR